MDYNISFNIIGIIICGLVLLISFINNRFKNLLNHYYLYFVITFILYSFLNIYIIIKSHNLSASNISFVSFLVSLRFMLLIILLIAYATHIISYTANYKRMKISKVILSLSFIATTILIITNHFTDFVYYYDSNFVYCQGFGSIILDLIMLLVVTYNIYLFYDKKALFSKFQIRLLYVLYVIVLLSIFLQMQSNQLYFISFGLSIFVLFSYYIIQMNNEYIDNNTNTLTEFSFQSVFNKNIYYKKQGKIVLVKFTSFEYLKKYVPKRTIESEIDKTAKVITSIVGNLYYLGNGAACYFVKEDEDPNDSIEKISEIFSVSNLNSKFKLKNVYKFHVIEYPKYSKDYETLKYLISYCLNNPKLEYITYFNDYSINAIKREMDLSNVINKSIKDNSFEVMYQPIYNLKTKKFSICESLVRITDNSLGFISPEDFIISAEKNGLVSLIDKCVIDDVFNFVKSNDLEKLGLKKIDINLSAKEFLETNLADTLVGYIDEQGISRDMICFEITETAESGFRNRILSISKKLKEYGIAFSLDDYGYGNSSFDYFEEFDFDNIKFDKKFLLNIFNNKEVMTNFIVNVNLQHDLNNKIILEGVETKKEFELAKSVGIDFIQGYYFSKPLSEKEFLKFLEENN